MAPPPRVSIVILNLERYELTVDCVRSLLSCTFRDFSIIVVDNGTKHDSVNILRTTFPGLKVIAVGENLGFNGGNNVGLREALEEGGEYLLFLNNDTIVDKGFMEPLLKALSEIPGAGAVSPAIYYHDFPDEIWCCGDKINLYSGFPTMGKPCRKGLDIIPSEYYSGCAFLMKAEVLKKIGSFDEDYFLYGDDIDLSLRLRKMGYGLYFIPKSRIWHRTSKTTGSDSYVYMYYTSRASLLLHHKHHTGIKKFFYLSITTAYHLLRGVKRSLKYLPNDASRTGSIIAASVHGIIDGLCLKTGRTERRWWPYTG